ncbi:FAD:protein FMN transferase [Sphingomonas sp.]|uniref:FAD:protein FMN transferase n=1 Tax=Sphingomonas sp. TaxID=28214 RepID=UPI00307F279E
MITRCRPLLGTLVEITVPDVATAAIAPAFDAIAHVHARMSFHESGSDLGRLRAAMPGEMIAVDRETIAVLRMALAFYEATDGLFDVTIGRQLVSSRFLPKDGLGHLNRFNGTSADIAIVDDTQVRIGRRVLIDLGGIAKGHAVDRAVEVLIAHGAPMGLVNAGGDLRAFGDHDWPVQLRDADDVVRFMVPARNCAIASSANLLNRKRLRGSLHGPHIGLDRKPVLVDERITVVAEWCIIADAMTKIAMVDPALADDILAAHKGYVLRNARVAATMAEAV